MKLNQKRASVTKRVLVYGASKTGKTELVGKLAEHYKLLWFDNEQGWSTLLKLPDDWQSRIDIISVPDSKVFPIAVETWLKVIKGTKTSICVQHGKVSCALCAKNNEPVDTVCLDEVGLDTIVVFDSLTQLTNSMISHITKDKPDDYKLQLDDWGNLKFLMDKFLSQVQAAGYNIVCITHEEMVQMEDGKQRIVPSSGSAKSSMFTAKYFDEVVYTEMINKKHRAGSSTNYSMQAVTGSRSGVVMEKQEVPTLLDIFTSWKDSDVVSNVSSEVSINTGTPVTITNVPPVTSTPTVPELTPAQQALLNLRLKRN